MQMRRGAMTAVSALGGAALALSVSVAVAAQDGSPAPGASPAPGLLGATTEVFRDDMSAPGTWELVEDDTGVTAYDTKRGELLVSVTQDRANVWDDAEMDAAYPVLRVEAWIATSGEGAAGVACGSATGLPRWLWAGTDGDAGWIFGRLIDGRLTVATRGDLPVEVDGRGLTLAIECASDPAAGGDQAVVTADGIPVHATLDIPVGPYDKGSIIVAADVAPEEARFDDVVISAGDAFVPAPSVVPSPAP